MRNVESWQPSKFVQRDGRLGASRDPSAVAVRSRLVVDTMAPLYEAAITQYAHGHLLDLGCGRVPLFGTYRSRVRRHTCVDWPGSLHGNQHVDVAVDLTSPLPFRADTFDTVLATDVLEHLPDPQTFWRELARVLKPNGHVILGVPFLYWLHELPHDYLRHTESSLSKHCDDVGLLILSLKSYGGPLSVTLDIVGKNIWTESRAAAFQSLASRFVRSRLGAKLDARNQRLFPMGYCLVAVKPSAAPRPTPHLE